MPDARETPLLACGRGIAQVGCERAQPRLSETGSTTWSSGHTDRSVAQGSVSRVDSRAGGQGGADQGPRKREVDVCADPVGATSGRPEPRGELLGQPSFDPTGGDRHDLGGHDVVERDHEKIGEHGDEPVSTLRTVEEEHSSEAGY